MPDSAAVVRYTRTGPWDSWARTGSLDSTEREVTKAEGDGILELLRDWESFEDLRPKPTGGHKHVCRWRPPVVLVLSMYSENGCLGNIEFRQSKDEALLGIHFPGVWMLRVPDEAAGVLMSLFDAWKAADRKEFQAEVLVEASGAEPAGGGTP